MSIPRGLTAEEKAAWARLAESVTPLAGRRRPVASATEPAKAAGTVKPAPPPTMPARPAPIPATRPAVSPSEQSGLDGHWDRKLKQGVIRPDYTLDLHGHSLDTAYDRLMSGLDQARAMEARVVLLIAGRSRPVDPADRAEKRGAIRAKILDWLAASRHEGAISAVRRAHIRHGGEGALYLVLKRAR